MWKALCLNNLQLHWKNTEVYSHNGNLALTKKQLRSNDTQPYGYWCWQVYGTGALAIPLTCLTGKWTSHTKVRLKRTNNHALQRAAPQVMLLLLARRTPRYAPIILSLDVKWVLDEMKVEPTQQNAININTLNSFWWRRINESLLLQCLKAFQNSNAPQTWVVWKGNRGETRV